jgi:hypothetical protein
MFRLMIATTACLCLAALSGCMSGPQCNDCSGCGNAGYMASGPLDSLRMWRRSLTCGAGCGETYYDEWTSTPPDCVDPCPQFAGDCGSEVAACPDCGGHCGVRGGCGIRPLQAVARVVKAVYGKRLCSSCGYESADCACGETSVYDSYDSGCGCASCNGGMADSQLSSSPVQAARQHQMAQRHRMAHPGSPMPRTGQMAQTQMMPATNSPVRQAQRIPEGPGSLRR